MRFEGFFHKRAKNMQRQSMAVVLHLIGDCNTFFCFLSGFYILALLKGGVSRLFLNE